MYEFLDDIRKEIADFLKNASDEEHDAFFYDMGFDYDSTDPKMVQLAAEWFIRNHATQLKDFEPLKDKGSVYRAKTVDEYTALVAKFPEMDRENVRAAYERRENADKLAIENKTPLYVPQSDKMLGFIGKLKTVRDKDSIFREDGEYLKYSAAKFIGIFELLLSVFVLCILYDPQLKDFAFLFSLVGTGAALVNCYKIFKLAQKHRKRTLANCIVLVCTIWPVTLVAAILIPAFTLSLFEEPVLTIFFTIGFFFLLLFKVAIDLSHD